MATLLHLSGILQNVNPNDSAEMAFDVQCHTNGVGALLELLETPLLRQECIALSLNGVLDAYNWLLCCFPASVGERVVQSLKGSGDESAKSRSKKTKSTLTISYASGVVPQIVKLLDSVICNATDATPLTLAETIRRALQFVISVNRISPNDELLRPLCAPNVLPAVVPALCLGELPLGEGNDAVELIPSCCEELLCNFPTVMSAVVQKCKEAIVRFDASSDMSCLRFVSRTVTMLKRLGQWNVKQATTMVANVVQHVSSVKPSMAGNIIEYAVAMDIPLVPLKNEEGLVPLLLRENKWDLLGDAAESLHRSLMTTCDFDTFKCKFDALFTASLSNEAVYSRLLYGCIEELLRACEENREKCEYILRTCEPHVLHCAMDVTILLVQLHAATGLKSVSLLSALFEKCIVIPLTANSSTCFDICRSIRLLPYFLFGCVRGCPVLMEDNMMDDDFTVKICSFEEKACLFGSLVLGFTFLGHGAVRRTCCREVSA